jgi:Mn-dependent DtxR family transcriptional regulator
MERRFGWEPRRLQRVLSRLLKDGWVERAGEGLRLTARGARALESSGRMELAHRL